MTLPVAGFDTASVTPPSNRNRLQRRSPVSRLPFRWRTLTRVRPGTWWTYNISRLPLFFFAYHSSYHRPYHRDITGRLQSIEAIRQTKHWRYGAVTVNHPSSAATRSPAPLNIAVWQLLRAGF